MARVIKLTVAAAGAGLAVAAALLWGRRNTGAVAERAAQALEAAVGERVQVVWVSDESVPVQPGETGTVVSIDEGTARVAFDRGAELAVDARVVRLRALRRSA